MTKQETLRKSDKSTYVRLTKARLLKLAWVRCAYYVQQLRASRTDRDLEKALTIAVHRTARPSR